MFSTEKNYQTTAYHDTVTDEITWVDNIIWPGE